MALLGIDVADVGQGHVRWLEEHLRLPWHAAAEVQPTLSRRGPGPIDFAAMATSGAADGLSWGVAKVSQGTGFSDPQWTANRAGLLGHGKPTGGYHMLSGAPGAAQADHYLSLVGEGVGLALDVELAGTGGQVRPFLDRLCSKRPGAWILVYSSRGLWSLAAAGGVDISGYPVFGWHAGVRNGAYSPASGSLAAIWAAVGQLSPSIFGGLPASRTVALQFTDHASVPGCTGGVDGDIWLATADQLTAWTTGDPMDEQSIASAVAYKRLSGIAGQFTPGQDPSVGELLHHGVRGILDTQGAVAEVQADVAALKSGGVDVNALASQVTAQVLAGLDEQIVQRVLDGLAARLQG